MDVSGSLLEYVRIGVEGEWQARCCDALSCHRVAWGNVSVTTQAKAPMQVTLSPANALSPSYGKSQS